jgi:lipopolysaccharide export system protein LptA
MKSRISADQKNSNHFQVLAPGAGLWIFIFFLSAAGFANAYNIKDDREISSRKPVHITASQLTFDRQKGLTKFEGQVKATHGLVILNADTVQALSENKEASALGHVIVEDPGMGLTMSCGNLEYQDMMNTMTAHEQPVLVFLDESGLPITIKGRQMEMNSEKKTVVIRQNVQVLHQEGLAEAQKATFLSKDDKFILEEEPQITLQNGKLSGRRIVSNIGSDRRILIEGMAEAVFYPGGLPSTSKGAPNGAPSGASNAEAFQPTSPDRKTAPITPTDTATPEASAGKNP